MAMRRCACGALIGLAIFTAASHAHAQAAPAPAPAPATELTAPPIQPVRASIEPQLEPANWWLGGSMDLLFFGSIEQAMMGAGTSVDTNTTVGFGGVLEYMVSPLVSIGFAPRVLIGVRPERVYESSNQLDLRMRVAVGP